MRKMRKRRKTSGKLCGHEETGSGTDTEKRSVICVMRQSRLPLLMFRQQTDITGRRMVTADRALLRETVWSLRKRRQKNCLQMMTTSESRTAGITG